MIIRDPVADILLQGWWNEARTLRFKNVPHTLTFLLGMPLYRAFDDVREKRLSLTLP